MPTSNRVRIWSAVALIGVAFVVLYSRVFLKLVDAWTNDGNYSHGFLIIPLAAYLAWERRDQLAAAPLRRSVLGALLVVASVGVLGLGVLGSELFLTRLSMIGVITGIVLFMLGWSHLRILVFPLSMLLLMIPIPAIIFNQIAFPLQLLASRFGESVLSAASIPVLREGNVLILANTTLEVAEACSGIRSLISLLTLGIVFGYFTDRRVWVRTLIAASTVPIAIVANGLRVAGTGIAAHHIGPAAAEGFFHEFSGWVVFVVAFGMLMVMQRAVARFVPTPQPQPTALAA